MAAAISHVVVGQRGNLEKYGMHMAGKSSTTTVSTATSLLQRLSLERSVVDERSGVR